VPGLRAAALAAIFAALVGVSFGRWGHARADLGGALDRAARIADGAILYRDVQSPYGPLPDYVVAGAFRLFGIHLAIASTIGLALVLLESFLLWRIVRRFCTPAQSSVGLVAFWVLFAFTPGLFGWVLPNTFASTGGATLATLALALAVTARERPCPARFVAASIAAGAAGLCKPDYGFAAALTVLAAALLAPVERRGRLVIAGLLPGLLVALATLALFLCLVSFDVLVFDNLYRVRSLGRTLAALRAGVPSWRDLIATNAPRYLVEMPLRAAGVALGLTLAERGGARRLAGLVVAAVLVALPLLPGYRAPLDFTFLASSLGFAWSPATWLVVAAVALPAARRGEAAAAALVLAGLWSAALAVRWDLRLVWPAYYGVLAPFLLISVVGRVAALLVSRHTALAAACVVAVPVVLQGVAYAQHFTRYYRFVLAYPRGTMKTQAVDGQPMATVIDYVRAHTTATDWVAVYPEERLINFFSERRHPTRDSGVGPGWLATPADEESCIAELEARRPRVIVLSNRRWPEFGAQALGSYNPLLRAWIEREYVPVLTTMPALVRYTVFVPRDVSAAVPPP